MTTRSQREAVEALNGSSQPAGEVAAPIKNQSLFLIARGLIRLFVRLD